MKNQFIIPSIIIAAAILGGFWMLKSQSKPQKVIVVQPPGISINQAADRGNIEAVKQHLDAGTDVNAKGRSGQTPLHDAAINGHKEIAELLISKGADVNAKGGGSGGAAGITPLHATVLAASENEISKALPVGHYRETVELLIAKGADVNAKVN